MAGKTRPKTKSEAKPKAKPASAKLSMNDFIKMLAKTKRNWNFSKFKDSCIRSNTGMQCPLTRVAIDAGGDKLWTADNYEEALKFIGLSTGQANDIMTASDRNEDLPDRIRRLRLRILRACGLK